MLAKVIVNWLKNFPFIVIGLGLWILVSCSMILAYRNEWYVVRNQPRSIFEKGDLDESNIVEIVELNEGDILSQKVENLSAEITGIGFWVDTDNAQSKGFMDVCLKNKTSGEDIQEWNINLAERKSRDYINFILDDVLTVSRKEVLQIDVSVRGVEGELPKVTLVNKDEKGFDFSYNNEVLNNKIIPFKVFSGTYDNLKYFAWALYIGMTSVFAIILFMITKKKTLQFTFVGVAFITGMIYLFIIPPFMVPDEASHFVTAYMQSSKLLDEPALDNEGRIIVSSEDLWGADTKSRFATRENYLKYLEGALGRSDNTIKSYSTREPLNAMHPGYFPQVIGITLGRLFSMNSEQLLLFGRFFALIWYCFVMYWAIKLMPFKKIVLFLVGILPMTMQMVVSYNYDSVLFGICFLTFSYLMYLIYEKKMMKISDWGILAIFTSVIALIKFIYLPILMLAFLIPSWKFGGIRKKVANGLSLGLVGVVMIFLTQVSSVQSMILSTSSSVTDSGMKMSLGYCLENPLLACSVFYRTIERQVSNYLSEMLASPMGWLELHLPSIIVTALVIILLLSILNNDTECQKMLIGFKKYAFLAVSIVVICIMTALFFSWTTLGAREIEGIQGRYFLPILPMIMLLFQNQIIVLKKNIDKYLILFTGYLHCMVAFFATLTVITR